MKYQWKLWTEIGSSRRWGVIVDPEGFWLLLGRVVLRAGPEWAKWMR